MIKNTLLAKCAYTILHVAEKDRNHPLDIGRGRMVAILIGLLGEYSSIRLVYDRKKRSSAQATYTRSVHFHPDFKTQDVGI